MEAFVDQAEGCISPGEMAFLMIDTVEEVKDRHQQPTIPPPQLLLFYNSNLSQQFDNALN
jgi:hypothetical protein